MRPHRRILFAILSRATELCGKVAPIGNRLYRRLVIGRVQQLMTLCIVTVLTPSAILAAGEDAFYKLGPDSLPQEGVPKGKLLGPSTLPSEVFPGTQHAYWVYVPAQYDPKQPAALMVF